MTASYLHALTALPSGRLDWFTRRQPQLRDLGAGSCCVAPPTARSVEALRSGADIAGAARVLEAADRLREEVLGQPQHDIG